MSFIGRLFQKSVDLLALVAGLPIVLVIRCIRPIVEVRYGFFFVDRIGHFAFDLELYLSERAISSMRNRQVDLFFLEGDICNSALVEMMRRHLFVNQFIRCLFRAEELLPGRRSLIYPARIRSGSTDHAGVFSRVPTQLKFSAEEEREGEQYLRALNCPLSAKIVCLIVRDAAFLDATRPGKKWTYHSYRDTSLENYESTVLHLVSKGYWVFRMGKVVGRELDVNHPRVIDYASSKGRSDLLDIWLLARCFFTISTSTGLDSVADAFRRPIAFVNFLPLAWFQTWTHCVLAPCRLYWRSSGRELTCEEHFANSYLRTEDYDDADIEVQELSMDEILEISQELEEELTSEKGLSSEDREMQQEFWRLLRMALAGGIDSGVYPALPDRCRTPVADSIQMINMQSYQGHFLIERPIFSNIR